MSYPRTNEAWCVLHLNNIPLSLSMTRKGAIRDAVETLARPGQTWRQVKTRWDVRVAKVRVVEIDGWGGDEI